MLLEVSHNLTAELLDHANMLYKVQTCLCIVLKIRHLSLSAVGFACEAGEALFASMSRNIPNVEQSSRALVAMFQSPETTVCATVSVNSTRKVVASGIAKTSLRFIETTVVGIAILLEVVEIVDNAKAVDQKKLSDLVTRLEKAANEMENEMKIFDEVFATPSSSAQTPIITDRRYTLLYNYISNWVGRRNSVGQTIVGKQKRG